MKNSPRSTRTQLRQAVLLGFTLLTIAPLTVPAIAAPQTPAASPQDASKQKAQLMFVQSAEDIKVDPAKKTLRLVNVNQQTVYFADRPVRLAGNLTMAAYLDEWTKGAGPNNFTNDPPNATLSIYEPGRPDNTLVVVEISDPVVEGKDLIYTYRLLEGTLPKAGGATTLFIDWIGVGGGVGPGFYGVGAGTRGVGLYGGYGGPWR